MKKTLLIFIIFSFFKPNAQVVFVKKNTKIIDIQKINKKEFDSKKSQASVFIKYDSIRFPCTSHDSFITTHSI
jgi:hypothetical protein